MYSFLINLFINSIFYLNSKKKDHLNFCFKLQQCLNLSDFLTIFNQNIFYIKTSMFLCY